LVARVGISNVNRDQLDAALSVVPVTAVEVALSPSDDGAVRGGVVRRCEENEITVLAHSPLGGPRRVRRAEGEQTLAWVLAQRPFITPIPGTTRLDHLQENAGAAGVVLSTDVIARVDALINRSTVQGRRYAAAVQQEIDTEEFAEAA